MRRTLAFMLAGTLLLATVALARGSAGTAPGPPRNLPSAVPPEQAFTVDWWTIDGGGAWMSGGGEFELGAAIGQPDAFSSLQGGDFSMATGFWSRYRVAYATYLPLITRNMLEAPDLVVESIVAHANSVTVTVRNAGNQAVSRRFWVDLYVNPSPPPTHVNQTWPDLGSEGLAWSVASPAVPLFPGETLILTLGDPYFQPDYSHVEWPLEVGSTIYVQVDSYSSASSYGAVLEGHELTGGPYNNIAGPVLVTPGEGGTPVDAGTLLPLEAIPPRPQ